MVDMVTLETTIVVAGDGGATATAIIQTDPNVAQWRDN